MIKNLFTLGPPFPRLQTWRGFRETSDKALHPVCLQIQGLQILVKAGSHLLWIFGMIPGPSLDRNQTFSTFPQIFPCRESAAYPRQWEVVQIIYYVPYYLHTVIMIYYVPYFFLKIYLRVQLRPFRPIPDHIFRHRLQ